ncbi:MAG: hypothetical protein DMD29_00575 [Gemmatimonadetes bacterium]|nr:MAG: hypothetical protein DMD29_00575 [Gemmatimonadota bacterium]
MRRWGVAVGAVAGTALLPLLASGWAGARAERALAARIAGTTAAYIALVTPAASGSADYDLPHLLVEAGALARLPGWTSRLEVYRGTAPLVRATAGSLSAATMAALRQQSGVLWWNGAALAPLQDKGARDVVGAVAVAGRPGGEVWRRGALGGIAVPALILAIVLAFGATHPAARRPVIRAHGAVALLVGVAAYANVRAVARDNTDHWLEQTRLLVQEATARLPTTDVTQLATTIRPVARAGGEGADLRPGGDSAAVRVRRVRFAGEPEAVVAIRVGWGRWLALRTLPGETTTGGWLWLCLALAGLSPAVAALLGWVERSRARPRRLRETLTAWGFLAPAAAHLAVFSFAPILFALYLSVHRWSLGESAKPFVGLENFGRVLRDPLVWISLRNTVLFTVQVPITMAIALGLALLLRRHSLITRIARTAFFLPYVASVVAIALVWQWMYHADFGALNWALSALGLAPVDWLGNPRTALAAVMVVSIWTQVGYQMVVFLAGLQGIPDAYLDAARVDGANAWRRFWRVTFPLLKPVTLFVLVTGIIGSFQVFTTVYVLTGGGPLHATDVLAYRIYQSAWGLSQFGSASALSLLLFAILFWVTWTQFKLLGKRVEYA